MVEVRIGRPSDMHDLIISQSRGERKGNVFSADETPDVVYKIRPNSYGTTEAQFDGIHQTKDREVQDESKIL